MVEFSEPVAHFIQTASGDQPRPVGVPDGWLSDPDSIPEAVIDACRVAIRMEFGDNGTNGYYKRILAKVFAGMVASAAEVQP